MRVELVNCTEDPVGKMAEAARTCTNESPENVSDKKVVEHVIKSGHLSITEFAWFHFKVSGVSRILTHQLVRKRIASFAQRSQRYVDEEGFSYVTPFDFDGEVRRVFEQHMIRSRHVYKRLRKLGVKKEDARFVLPEATESTIHVGMNFHSLIDFCKERMCSKAQWEIRKLAVIMGLKVESVVPFLGKFLQPKCFMLGRCPEESGRCGDFTEKDWRKSPYLS